MDVLFLIEMFLVSFSIYINIIEFLFCINKFSRKGKKEEYYCCRNKKKYSGEKVESDTFGLKIKA